jgi:hypothetical protein
MSCFVRMISTCVDLCCGLRVCVWFDCVCGQRDALRAYPHLPPDYVRALFYFHKLVYCSDSVHGWAQNKLRGVFLLYVGFHSRRVVICGRAQLPRLCNQMMPTNIPTDMHVHCALPADIPIDTHVHDKVPANIPIHTHVHDKSTCKHTH